MVLSSLFRFRGRDLVALELKLALPRPSVLLRGDGALPGAPEALGGFGAVFWAVVDAHFIRGELKRRSVWPLNQLQRYCSSKSGWRHQEALRKGVSHHLQRLDSVELPDVKPGESENVR